MKYIQETAAPRIDRELPPAGRNRGMKCVVLTARPVAGSILVMDDDPSVRKVTALLLEASGYRVATARQGAEALELYRAAMQSGSPFDAVILDLSVPDETGGRETMRKLLELDPDVKAIVSSGSANDPVIEDYRGYGFRGALPKPFALRELLQTLEQAGAGNEARLQGV